MPHAPVNQARLKPATVPGWFGKIPSLGDFALRRLPDAFVHRWDRWLQHGLARARSDLGAAWQSTYLVAPIVRFWVGPGVLGPGGWAGLMMPSVDRVGRHFPLTIARPLDTLAVALAARGWFAALDRTARQVLDVTFTVDDLEHELIAASKVEAVAVDDAARRLAESLLGRCAPQGACSIWWCGEAGDATMQGEFLCFDGLPPATDFALLLGVTA
jgi:type VI secretion system protein ImpM